jgi:hypothetical protein
MQNPIDRAEASIPTGSTVTKNALNWDRIVNMRRKAAKRTHDESSTAPQPQPQPQPQPAPFPTTTELHHDQHDSTKKISKGRQCVFHCGELMS